MKLESVNHQSLKPHIASTEAVVDRSSSKLKVHDSSTDWSGHPVSFQILPYETWCVKPVVASVAQITLLTVSKLHLK